MVTTVANAIGTNAMPDLAAVLEVGACLNHTNYYAGIIDEFRISKGIARHISSFEIPITAYGEDQCSLYIGTVRPIQGVKFYVGTPNTNTASVSGYYWDGDSWVGLSSLVDGTSATSKTLAQTGTVSFSTTVGAAKERGIKDNFAYYFYFLFAGISSGTTITYCTVDAPVQNLVDIWDGTPRTCLQFYKATSSAYTDLTTHISSAYPYSSSLDYTYAQVGSLATSTDKLYAGFSQPMTGLQIVFPDSTKTNTTA